MDDRHTTVEAPAVAKGPEKRSAGGARFGLVVAGARRRSRGITIVFAGEEVAAFEGESLLCAILRGHTELRRTGAVGAPRAGFCLMGACQDCWVWLSTGRMVRACTTPVEDGMVVHPAPPQEVFAGG
jgi:hypothetical protein